MLQVGYIFWFRGYICTKRVRWAINISLVTGIAADLNESL